MSTLASPLVCPLCDAAPGGGVLLLHRAADWRVVRVLDAPAFPAFYRLIWSRHVAEFSALSPAERSQCMEAVAAIERVLIRCLTPTKVNLASLGNVVPHLHWHVTARFDWDSHYPQSIWSAPQRDVVAGEAALARLATPIETVDQAVCRALSALAPQV